MGINGYKSGLDQVKLKLWISNTLSSIIIISMKMTYSNIIRNIGIDNNKKESQLVQREDMGKY